MFIDHGDVTVVKNAPFVYWVDFESFDSDELTNAQGALGRIINHVKNKHRGLIRNIREYREAHRFP